ncbi:hypothetical protein Lal_00041720 [Lupinus albus]|nr:hypothetical protein Lal_00041720 [Lupinus albus]
MATGSEVVGSNGAPSFKKGVRAEVQVINVQYLIDLVPKIPKDVQEQFEKEYGRLIDLILITVNTEALKAMSAMIQYWNPTLRVFEFPNLDASPTIEEYEVLLDIGKSGRLKVYQFTDHQNVTESLIEELIGTRPEPFDIIKQGEIYGLKTAFLKKHLIKTIEQEDWVLFKPAFALAIYGVVLFPFVYDMVDQAAIDVFTKFKKFLVNPVPAVLAETLLSFQMCHERGVHKVRCCIQLLFVWMITRFKHHQYPDWSRYPLRRFRKIAINPMQLSDWKKIFVEITPRNFGTKCGLYDRHPEIMYSCGDFTNMMLMGPRGCITFNPALILGQLKWGMMPVSLELLQGSMVWYKDGETSKETLISIRNALKRIRLYEKKELGEHQSYYTPEYKELRKDRMKSTTIPPPTLPQEPPKQSEKELLQANQIRLLEAKLEEARNEIEKYGFSVEKLDKIIETQKKEHTSLKRDYASLCSTSEKYHLIRVGKEKDKKIVELIKMNEEKDEQISNMSHQLKARGRALHSAQKDIHVLEAKAESLQALAQDTKNEESHAWATMKEYQAALEKTLEREGQLKTIMKEMEKAHHQALVEANNDKVYLSEQLSLLEATHDELVTRQQEWLHNWDHMLQECKWDKDRWEERCRKIIDGLGNFADDWLRNFEDARGELQMYPETELRPAMRAFYETCDQLAWKLRKWRIAATRDF